MSEALVPAAAATDRDGQGRGAAGLTLQQVIVDAGPNAAARFLEFFAGRIANERTRAAYGRAVGQFLAWCEAQASAWMPSPRSTWPPTSVLTPGRSSSTWPRSACSATGSSSARSSP